MFGRKPKMLVSHLSLVLHFVEAQTDSVHSECSVPHHLAHYGRVIHSHEHLA